MTELQKSQFLRLWDVFGFGPALIVISMDKKLSKPVRLFLLAEGVLVIAYNGANYLANKRLMKQEKITPINFRQEIRSE